MINEFVSSLSYFGVVLTGAVYLFAVWLQKKTKLAILNPLIVSCVICMLILLITGIDYNVFLNGKLKADGSHDGTGAAFFQIMLTPTTVCLAIPLYEKISELKKNPMATVSAGDGFPVAILNRNQPAFYCVPAELYEKMLDALDDQELVKLVAERSNQPLHDVDLDKYL